MNNETRRALDTPWKIFSELRVYALMPFVYLYLVLQKKIYIKRGFKFYGMPKVLKYKDSVINIGSNFENRNWWWSNPLGINHPTIFCTWSKNAQIEIGNDVGISGGSIVASKKIEIGDGTIIGTNCLIIDSDFHPLKSKYRRYDKKNIKSKEIIIGKNVFIGTGCIILKGTRIIDDSIIPAGEIVRGSYKSGGNKKPN